MVLWLYLDLTTVIDCVHFVLAIEQLGNPGWNWDAHLKYAKKSERYVAFQKESILGMFVVTVVDWVIQVCPPQCARDRDRASTFQSCAPWNRW
jgi:hypothetical protein